MPPCYHCNGINAQCKFFKYASRLTATAQAVILQCMSTVSMSVIIQVLHCLPCFHQSFQHPRFHLSCLGQSTYHRSLPVVIHSNCFHHDYNCYCHHYHTLRFFYCNHSFSVFPTITTAITNIFSATTCTFSGTAFYVTASSGFQIPISFLLRCSGDPVCHRSIHLITTAGLIQPTWPSPSLQIPSTLHFVSLFATSCTHIFYHSSATNTSC